MTSLARRLRQSSPRLPRAGHEVLSLVSISTCELLNIPALFLIRDPLGMEQRHGVCADVRADDELEPSETDAVVGRNDSEKASAGFATFIIIRVRGRPGREVRSLDPDRKPAR